MYVCIIVYYSLYIIPVMGYWCNFPFFEVLFIEIARTREKGSVNAKAGIWFGGNLLQETFLPGFYLPFDQIIPPTTYKKNGIKSKVSKNLHT